MPGGLPDKVRQGIVAPLQDLPNILEVCGLCCQIHHHAMVPFTLLVAYPFAMTNLQSRRGKPGTRQGYDPFSFAFPCFASEAHGT